MLGHRTELVNQVGDDEPAQTRNHCYDDDQGEHDGDAACLDAHLALQPLDQRLDDISQDKAHDKRHQHRTQVVDEPHAYGDGKNGQYHPHHAVKVIFLLYCL